MKTKRWNQVQSLFKEVLELDKLSKEDRLQAIRNEDEELYREVVSLLAADADRTSILDGFLIDSVNFSELLSLDGSHIGPFEIIRQVGSGGMGNVYLAKRVEGGFEQEVALKLIKHGINSKQILQRFESERSILARLQHPNIARLVDGGLTDDGCPWFAMEYVEGEPLKNYSRRKDLTVEEKLKLFVHVASAVQYAHRNLVVHRDLKPTNILVSEEEQAPGVKLLDFGIAQIVSDTNDHKEGSKSMTRSYASPEQLSGARTSTLSDIYSLGIVLYELLAGCHPDPEYRNEDERPEKIPAELAAICWKAMQEIPENRFGTVADLNEEIDNWLKGKPVSSFSNKTGYTFKKFIARNRVAASISGLAVLAIVLLVFFYTAELKEEKETAEAEAARAAKITEVLGNSLRSVDPTQTAATEISARTMLDHSLGYIGSELTEDPDSQAKLMLIMAETYANLGIFDVADSLSAVSYKLYQTRLDTTELTYIDVLTRRSDVLLQSGAFEQAGSFIERAVSLAKTKLPANSLEYANVYYHYNNYLYEQGDYHASDSVLKAILPIYENNKETAQEEYLDVIFYLGTNYRKMAMYDSAEVYLLKSLELSRSFYQGIHENIASNLNHLSSLYQNMGDYEKALPYAGESFEQRKQIFGAEHVNTIASQANMARTLSGAGRLEEAAEAYREVIQKIRNLYGEENHYLVGLLQSYGSVYLGKKEYDKAEAIIRESLALSEKLLPDGDIRQAYPMHGLADALLRQGKYEEALVHAAGALGIRENILTEDNILLASSRYITGLCRWHIGEQEEAKKLLNEALAVFNTSPERYRKQIEEIESLGL